MFNLCGWVSPNSEHSYYIGSAYKCGDKKFPFLGKDHMQLALVGQVKSEFRILWGLGHVLNNHEWEIPISAFTFKEEYLNF